MLSNTDIKRPLKYITQVFELTSSNIKYVTVRHDSFLLSLLGPSITKTSSIRRNPIQSVQVFPTFDPIQSNPWMHPIRVGLCCTPSNTWFPGPTRVLNPNGISIVQQFLQGSQTDKPHYSVGNNRPHLCTQYESKNNNNTVHIYSFLHCPVPVT